MSTKQEAQAAYDAAQERYEAAYKDVAEKREELDGCLFEEAVRNNALFLGYEEGDEEGIEESRAIMLGNRAARRAMRRDS